MTSALGDWLALREPADRAARAESLNDRLRDVLRPRTFLRGLDLCTGTGSNLRYLLGRLSGPQEWLAIDLDPVLLGELARQMRRWAEGHGGTISPGGPRLQLRGPGLHCDVETRGMDLATLPPAIFEGRHLVTASALLDLVSETWMREMAHQCRFAGAAALFTITYTGRSSCDPAEPEDDVVLTLFNRHQRTDKGLGGPAAGPDAARAAERAFRDVGYRVERASSDWIIEPHDRALQCQLIDGWALAASEIAPDRELVIDDWHRRRLAHVGAGRSRVIVCHDDLIAWPEGPA